MLIDDYGMRIFLSSIPNGHVLALGISGTGKSYYLNRRIEELRYSGETCLVLDWAGSFSETERKKSRITVQGGIQDLNLSKSKICLPVMNGKSEDIDMFVSWITNVFRIRGSVQRIMIREAAESMLREQEPSLFRFLEKCYELKESAESLGCIDDVRRMEKIIERVEPFILSDVITFWDGTGIGLDSSQLVIVELDSLTPSLKKMCVDTIFWWVWQKAKSRTFFFRNVVLDEAQHINFNEDIPSCLLREGRKFSINLLMATQFIEGLEKMEVSTLMQAGNILFFRPEISNIRKVASQIDACHTKQWIDILNSLQVGEAILRGHYYLNDSEKNLSLPIKVKVEKEYPILKENTNRE